MKLKFIPIDFVPFDFQGRNYVQLIGRTKEGKRVCVIDSYEANFWAILKPEVSQKKAEEMAKKIEKISVQLESRTTKVLKTEIHDKKYLGADVRAIRIFITNHKDGHSVADQIGFPEVDKRREYDLPLVTKYTTEKGVEPLVWQDVEGELLNNSLEFGGIDAALEVDMVVKAEKISKSVEQPEFVPKMLAFDIETDELRIGQGNILMISLCGDKFKKVLTWKNCPIKQDYVECFRDECEMLEKFTEYVRAYSPDLLVGYFSDGFDIPYLRAAAQKHKIKLSLGLDGSQPQLSRGRVSSAKIHGIVHADIFKFIETAYSQYLNVETLSLDDVSAELLGEKKHEFDFKKLAKMSEKDWKEFFAYNLQDSALAYKLAEKIWPDIAEFSKLVQEPVYDIMRDGMSTHVENYIIHHLKQYNEIAEKRPLEEEIGRRRMMGKYEGAFVFQPKPGLYENLAMFDFTSMYTSVIVTYNLSLSTLLHKKEKNSLEVDIGKDGIAHFTKEKGFFPAMMEDLFKKRKVVKAEYNKNPNVLLRARSNAFKIVANAAYGYQGFFGARYYCREAAAATAALAKKSILDAIDKIKGAGYEIVYSDTDSIAFLVSSKSHAQVKEFLEQLNKNLPGIMELELEDFYKRGLFVSKRTTKEGTAKEGAKKKYALVNASGKVKIRGFETVRRDWCDLARVLQNKVIEQVLESGNEKSSVKTIKEAVKRVKAREVSKDDLIIHTQLKKPIEEYLNISPHVIAAKKLEARNVPVSQGMAIEYFIAESSEKKALVRDRVNLPDEKGEYDITYYLDKQLLPAVENILDVFGVNIREIIEGSRQKKLF